MPESGNFSTARDEDSLGIVCKCACVCVRALHGDNRDSLFVCISEHPPCGSLYTCRETRKRFLLECYPTFRNCVWNPCSCFGCMKDKGRQMLRRDADLLGLPAQGRDCRCSHHVRTLTCAQLSWHFAPCVSLNALK